MTNNTGCFLSTWLQPEPVRNEDVTEFVFATEDEYVDFYLALEARIDEETRLAASSLSLASSVSSACASTASPSVPSRQFVCLTRPGLHCSKRSRVG